MKDIYTLLHEAVRHKMFDYVMMICEAGANRNHRTKAGETPLIVACKFGCLDEVEYLCWRLDVGARLDNRDFVGNTALNYLKKTFDRGPEARLSRRLQGTWSHGAVNETRDID